MFTLLLTGSFILGIMIAWIGLFGNKDHDNGRGRNDRW
jgi:hypothetical protein